MGAFAQPLEELLETYGPELEEAATQAVQAVAGAIAAVGAWIAASSETKPTADDGKKKEADKAEEASDGATSAGDQFPDEDPDETEQECKQYKRLSRGEIKKLQDKGIDPHDLKPKYNGSRYDLFKTPKGDVVVLPKNGVGEPDFTGVNLNDY